MALLLGNKLRSIEGGGLAFWCPGCKTTHAIQHGEGPGPRWQWNTSPDKPTFRPSVLIRMGHYAYSEPRDTCWCTYNAAQLAKAEPPSPYSCQICHSFVTDGRIQFLDDCTHDMAGQTVDLPDFPT